jgi:hypothetical protein
MSIFSKTSGCTGLWMQIEVAEDNFYDGSENTTFDFTLQAPSSATNLVPMPTNYVNDIYEAVMNCFNLHPDPSSPLDGNDDTGRIVIQGM